MTPVDPIVLKEYKPEQIAASHISAEAGRRFWMEFGDKVSIVEPSFKNGSNWELTSLGWVGFIHFSEELRFYLQPKISLRNLFGMWEYAYRLKIDFASELYECKSLQEFYEQLAIVLAKRILDRSRKGYYRDYLSRDEELSYLRGRLDLRHTIRKPWEARPRCHYQENTADVTENQILAWTLYSILRSGLCTERVLPSIRNSYRSISQAASLQPFEPKDCLGRIYNRLNQDYQPLHGLCQFFLENSGPSYQVGDHTMLPFLVDMAALFELFVAEWLRKNLPTLYELSAQEHMEIGESGRVSTRIDLVIYVRSAHQPLIVLDTKYKQGDHLSNADIYQVAFYALAKGCQQAVLVYPEEIAHPLDVIVNGIRIRTATFSLHGDLEEAGRRFLSHLELTA